MKYSLSLLLVAIIGFNQTCDAQLLKKFKDKVVDKANQKVDDKLDKAAQKTVDTPEEILKKKKATLDTTKTTTTSQTVETAKDKTQTNLPTSTGETTKPAEFKTYANFDFVPGDTVLFEDDFATDQLGEFPSHWELENGQAVLNKFENKTALLITDGNAGWVSPLMKKKTYLGNEWTLEFDNWKKSEAYQTKLFLQTASKEDIGTVFINTDGITVNCLNADNEGKSYFGAYPTELQYDVFNNKWHHISMAYKNKQLKVYVDELRVISVPNTYITPARIGFGGIGSQDGPLIFSNVRLAAGGKMNMLGKKFTDSKIITHGINFDFLKATIKPESMGTLNMIMGVMKDNPQIKFEVGGHTSKNGQGSPAANLILSQQRSDAIMKQLIAMGIDASRLKAKGYGETKPIADNTTLDGQAQNRRVEFTKF